MKSNVSAAREIRCGSQASKPWWMSHEKHGMPSSSQTSRQVPLPAHGVETQSLGLEIVEQVLDQVAAAVAGPFPVAVLAGPMEMVQAGQVRHRAAFLGARGSRA